MIAMRQMKQGARRALILTACGVLCVALSGCGATRGLFGGGDRDREVSTASQSERIPVLAAEQVLSADENAAGPVNLPAPYVNVSWPQTGGAPTHAMQHPEAGALNRLWRRSIGAGDSRSGRITAQPVVEGGRVFAMDGRGRVGAFDADTGQQLWRRELRSESRRDTMGFGGGVAVAQGRVFVTSGVGMVSALSAQDGSVLWSAPTSVPLHSAPTVADGRVFAVTDDNTLLVIDAESGERLWSYQGIAEPARMLIASAPAVFGDRVVAPFGSGELVGLDVASGRPFWQDALTRAGVLAPISTLNDVSGSPVIYDGAVYAISHSGILAALSLQTGEQLWSLPAGGLHMPWLAGDTLFVMTGDAELLAVDRMSGSVRWLTQLPGFRNEERRRNKISWTGPVLAGGRLVTVSSRGEGRFYDPVTGDFLGQFNAGSATYVSPVIANGTLYVLDSSGNLSAYR